MTPRKAKLLAAAAFWIVRLLIGTLRIRVHNQGELQTASTSRLILAFWHNRLFLIPHFFNLCFPNRTGAALTSASKDGEILAAFLNRYGVHTVRGSSSRQGAGSLLKMKRSVIDGFVMGISPDGPRGPRYHLNPGIITLAQLSGALILPLRLTYSKSWRLKSWDAFEIPKPFAAIDITLLPLHQVGSADSPEQFEAERARLEQVMRQSVD